MRKIAFEVVVDVHTSDETAEQIQKSLKDDLQHYGWEVVSVATKSVEIKSLYPTQPLDTRTWKEKIADLAIGVEKMPNEKDNKFIREINEFCNAVVNDYDIHLGKTIDGKLELGSVYWRVSLPTLAVDINISHDAGSAMYDCKLYKDPNDLICAIIKDKGDKIVWLRHNKLNKAKAPMMVG